MWHTNIRNLSATAVHHGCILKTLWNQTTSHIHIHQLMINSTFYMTSMKDRIDIGRQREMRNRSHLRTNSQWEEEEDMWHKPWGRRGAVQVEAEVGQPGEPRRCCRRTSLCHLLKGDARSTWRTTVWAALSSPRRCCLYPGARQPLATCSTAPNSLNNVHDVVQQAQWSRAQRPIHARTRPQAS
jgi:hypothetical protein